MTLHQRTSSNSVRIAIPASPTSGSAARLDGRGDRTARKIPHHGRSSSTGCAHHDRNSAPWQAIGQPAASTGHHRPRSGRFSVRLTRRQIAIILGSLLAVIVLLRQARSTSPQANKLPRTSKGKNKPKRIERGPFTPDGVPIVDRNVVFRRIQQIEEENAFQDEDEDEARSAGRLPVKYNPARPPVYRIPAGKPRNRPKVTEQDLETFRQSNLLGSAVLDREYCPNQPEGCKFLLPAWIGEQETKAQMHLYQLGLLAIALNRTLVLPNVSKSRMMSCASQPFEFYYEDSSLERLGIPTISFRRFTDWSRKRMEMPTSQIVAISSPSSDWSAGALEVDPSVDSSSIPSLPNRKLCLEAPRVYLNFTSYSPITIYPPLNWHKETNRRQQFGESLINTFSSDSVLQRSFRKFDKRGRLARWFGRSPATIELPSSADVLVFNYELRYPILHHEQLQSMLSHSMQPIERQHIQDIQDFRHFPYAPIWTDLAMQIVSSLSPFIAVHWRQETLPSDVIGPCGEALINHIEHRLLDSKAGYDPIKTVFLATDYPIEHLGNGSAGAVAHSGTFGKLLTEGHHSAMRNFITEFDKRLTTPWGIKLTTFSKEQASLKLSPELLKAITPPASENDRASFGDRNGRPRKKNIGTKIPPSGLDLAELDVGLLGIIDKTIAMHAEVFLTGLPWSNVKSVQAVACAKESSFTKQISEARRRTRSETPIGGDGDARLLWNDVEYWSREDEHVARLS